MPSNCPSAAWSPKQALDVALAASGNAPRVASRSPEANLAIARADLRLQEAGPRQCRDLLADRRHRCSNAPVNPGQTVAASMSAPILFVIAENPPPRENPPMELMRPPSTRPNIGDVQALGQTARFAVDAFPFAPLRCRNPRHQLRVAGFWGHR